MCFGCHSQLAFRPPLVPAAVSPLPASLLERLAMSSRQASHPSRRTNQSVSSNASASSSRSERDRSRPQANVSASFSSNPPCSTRVYPSQNSRGWESWHRSGNLRNVQSRIVHWTPRTLFKSLSHALGRRGALGELMDEGFRMCATSARSRRRNCSSALASSEHRTRMYIPRASCIRSIRYRQSGNLGTFLYPILSVISTFLHRRPSNHGLQCPSSPPSNLQ